MRFEKVNRGFFAAHVSDRGDDYFERFDVHVERAVAEHESGASLLYLVVAADDAVVGRVNVLDVDRPGETEIGFRVAQDVQGRGIATRAVGLALEEAARRGVRSVRARVAVGNLGSQRVLERCGFEPTGPAATPAGSDKTFLGYVKRLG